MCVFFFFWSPIFLIKRFLKKNSRFLYWVLACSQKYEGCLKFFLLSYLVCSQIWLNCLLDDCHFNYIRKRKKKNSGSRFVSWSTLFFTQVLAKHNNIYHGDWGRGHGGGHKMLFWRQQQWHKDDEYTRQQKKEHTHNRVICMQK
jgi:hypothetical protein